MPPVTKDGYRQKLTLAKQLGFNYASAAAPLCVFGSLKEAGCCTGAAALASAHGKS